MVSLSKQHKLQLLVVDDHELTRLSLKILFSRHKHIHLVGLASNGKEAIELVEAYHPEVVILDLQMPVMNGLTAAAYIKAIEPHAQILAYSSVEDPQTEVMCQTAPVDYFCPKDTPPETLVKLVNQLGSKALSYEKA